MRTLVDAILHPMSTQPKQPSAEQVATDAQANATAARIGGQFAATQGLPSCVTLAVHKAADALCAQKRVAGHEAVAAFGRTLGASDPTMEAMSLAPCEWALIPICQGESFKAAAPAAQAPSSFAKKAPPRSAAPPAPPPPSSDTRLIVGGVLVGALVLGGVFMLVKKKGSSS